MEIIPIRQEYIFSVMKHTMRASVEHTADNRIFRYYFDDRLVSEKTSVAGDFYTDDDCIRDVIDEYRKTNNDAYADLFNRHIDKVTLSARLLELELVNSGIVIKSKVKTVKDYYEVELSTDNGDNVFSGKIRAVNFPEVLEKIRLFTNTLEGISTKLTQCINELSNDKIEEIINWQE